MIIKVLTFILYCHLKICPWYCILRIYKLIINKIQLTISIVTYCYCYCHLERFMNFHRFPMNRAACLSDTPDQFFDPFISHPLIVVIKLHGIIKHDVSLIVVEIWVVSAVANLLFSLPPDPLISVQSKMKMMIKNIV